MFGRQEFEGRHQRHRAFARLLWCTCKRELEMFTNLLRSSKGDVRIGIEHRAKERNNRAKKASLRRICHSAPPYYVADQNEMINFLKEVTPGFPDNKLGFAEKG